MKKLYVALLLLWTPLMLRAADVYELLGTLTISGYIDQGDAEKVSKLLPSTRFAVQIRSIGGKEIEARKIGDAIAVSGLPLKVSGWCISACASEIFLLAKHRIVYDGGFVAFHGGRAAVAKQIAKLVQVYAQDHPGDERLQDGVKQWQSLVDQADLAESAGALQNYVDMRHRVEALTTPIVKRVLFDEASHSFTPIFDQAAVCDYWVPSREFLSEIGVEVTWKGNDPTVREISKDLKTPADRIYQGSILAIQPDAPNGCTGRRESPL